MYYIWTHMSMTGLRFRLILTIWPDQSLYFIFYLSSGPGHLAGSVSPAIDPGAIKHLPAAQVIRVECDAALAMGLVVTNLSIIKSKLQLQLLLDEAAARTGPEKREAVTAMSRRELASCSDVDNIGTLDFHDNRQHSPLAKFWESMQSSGYQNPLRTHLRQFFMQFREIRQQE